MSRTYRQIFFGSGLKYFLKSSQRLYPHFFQMEKLGQGMVGDLHRLWEVRVPVQSHRPSFTVITNAVLNFQGSASLKRQVRVAQGQ